MHSIPSSLTFSKTDKTFNKASSSDSTDLLLRRIKCRYFSRKLCCRVNSCLSLNFLPGRKKDFVIKLPERFSNNWLLFLCLCFATLHENRAMCNNLSQKRYQVQYLNNFPMLLPIYFPTLAIGHVLLLRVLICLNDS